MPSIKHILIALLATIGLASPAFAAQTIVNLSSLPIVFERTGDFPASGALPPGASVNLSSPFGFAFIEFQTLGDDDEDFYGFNATVLTHPDGRIEVREFTRPLQWSILPFPIPALYVVSLDNAVIPGEVDREPVDVGLQHRSVRFYASSDCQFCDGCTVDHDNNSTTPEVPRDMFGTIVNELMGLMVDAGDARGAIIAGDLTQNNRISHRNVYTDSIEGVERHFFDGLGNHDVDDYPARDFVRPLVRNRKRSTIRSNWSAAPAPHYSWDWHDVHFVQLNVVPSDRFTSQADLGREEFDALTYLATDLAETVGDSGRPIVLVHHYGFDNFSTGMDSNNQVWWDAGQRLDYWNVIKDYNVVLIIVGHHHYTQDAPGSIRFQDFDRPAGATGGPSSFKVVNAGAGLAGIFIEVEINARNQVRILARRQSGALVNSNVNCSTFGSSNCPNRTYRFDAPPIYVDPASGAEGYGWRDDPYPTIALGLEAQNLPPFSGTNPPQLPIEFASGNYPETGVIDHEVILQASDGGEMIIGRP